MSAKRAKKQGRLTPLGEQKYLVRRGEAPIARVLGPVIGERLAATFMRAALCAEIEEVRSDVRRRAPKTGVIYAPPPRTARATFAAAPRRSEESAPVRRMAMMLLDVLEHFEPGGQRVASRGLWLGYPNPPYRQCPNSVSGRVGVGVRELQRYCAILESAGVLKRWQPDSRSDNLKSQSGHCYNLWELQVPVMPAELHETLASWRASHVRAATKLQRQAAAAPQTPARAPQSESGQSIAARLLGLVDTS